MPEGTIISVSASRALTGAVVIEGSDAFPHAVRRLKESFPGIDWIVGAADGKRPAVILVADAELAEGAFHIGSETALSPVVHVSGGQVSGVIYGIEELIKRGGATPDRLSVAAEPIEASPGLAYPDVPDVGPLHQLATLADRPARNRRVQPLWQAAQRFPCRLPASCRFLQPQSHCRHRHLRLPARQPRRHRNGQGTVSLRQ